MSRDSDLLTLFHRGVAAFSPLDLSGLNLWLNPSYGVYQESTFTTPATADADPLGGIQDQSGAGNHFTQATALKRLIYKTGILNGRPSIRADGTDRFLGSVLANPALTTRFIVYANRSGTNGTLLGCSAAGSTVIERNANIFPDSSTINMAISPTLNSGNVLTEAFNYTADAYTAWVNGTQAGTSATAGAQNGNLVLGAYLNGGVIGLEPLNGDILEVLVYNRILTAGERAQVHAWIATRYALVIA